MVPNGCEKMGRSDIFGVFCGGCHICSNLGVVLLRILGALLLSMFVIF